MKKRVSGVNSPCSSIGMAALALIIPVLVDMVVAASMAQDDSAPATPFETGDYQHGLEAAPETIHANESKVIQPGSRLAEEKTANRSSQPSDAGDRAIENGSSRKMKGSVAKPVNSPGGLTLREKRIFILGLGAGEAE
jgi:hypothetical protein